MFHIIETQRFQITAAFNRQFTNQESGKDLCSVKFLYDTPYAIVFQDAETLLNYILDYERFDVAELRRLLRFKDIHIEEYEQIQPSEEYQNLQGGNCILKDGALYIVQRFDEHMRLISIAYDKDWV